MSVKPGNHHGFPKEFLHGVGFMKSKSIRVQDPLRKICTEEFHISDSKEKIAKV